MTSEHDRLLSEGPRTAPEPETADGRAAPTPTAEPASKSPLVKVRPRGAASGSLPIRRLLRLLVPLALVALVLSRGLRGGGSGWAFVLVWVVLAVVIALARMRRRS